MFFSKENISKWFKGAIAIGAMALCQSSMAIEFVNWVGSATNTQDYQFQYSVAPTYSQSYVQFRVYDSTGRKLYDQNINTDGIPSGYPATRTIAGTLPVSVLQMMPAPASLRLVLTQWAGNSYPMATAGYTTGYLNVSNGSSGCGASAPGPCADQTKRTFIGYYPSWSDNWFTAFNSNGTVKSDSQIYAESKLAKVPAQYSHVTLSFADPYFSWGGLAANNWSGTGINFNGTPKDIKEAIRVLHARNIKVIVAVGGANYNNWNSLIAEAGRAMSSSPIKTALKNIMVDLDIDGLDVDYEINGADDANVTSYARAIQAMREAVDAAGGSRVLTLAGWSTGADCISTTSSDSDCAGKISYWTGSAGRERLAFKKTLTTDASRKIANLLNVVAIMAYDAQTYHYDPLVAYDQYRRLLPSSTIVSIGLETAKEGWAGGKLMINNADATCDGSIITADQYSVPNPGKYTVERSAGKVAGTTANSRDGVMLWHILKADPASADTICGARSTATPAQVTDKVRSMLALPTMSWPY